MKFLIAINYKSASFNVTAICWHIENFHGQFDIQLFLNFISNMAGITYIDTISHCDQSQVCICSGF